MGIVLGLLQVALNLSTAGLLDMDFGSRESPQQRGVASYSWKLGQPSKKNPEGCRLGGGWEAFSICDSIKNHKDSNTLWANNLHLRS